MAKPKKDDTHDRVIENRRARFDYTITTTLEAGIVLKGTEVKSVREGKVTLTQGYIRAQGEPPTLTAHGITIEPYGPAGPPGTPRQHVPNRVRVLLAHKREIRKLAKESDVSGFTIVPLKIYFKNGFAKLLIGVAKGKSKVDKRHAIAKRDTKRDMDRALGRRER